MYDLFDIIVILLDMVLPQSKPLRAAVLALLYVGMVLFMGALLVRVHHMQLPG